MKKELQEQLFAIEPKWFTRNDIKNSLMCFGFEVGDGWFFLLQQLLNEIKYLDPGSHFEVIQVKEKFGGLRFYVSGDSEKIGAVIGFAENLSYFICEQCGGAGKSNKEGWISVQCDPCREKS